MCNFLAIRTFLFTAFIFLISIKSFSQDEHDKWVIGIGLNAVDFFPTNEPNTGNDVGLFNEFANAKDHWNIFAPKVNVTRHLKNKFSIDGSLSVNNLTKIGDVEVDNLVYFAIDGALQYRFLENYKNFTPFVFAGGGYTWIDWYGAGTINAGLGTDYWINDKFGVNVQANYKYSDPKYEQLLSHFYYSFSLVLKLSGRGKSKWSGSGKNCY